MYLDIINSLAAVGAFFFGYRIVRERLMKRTVTEIRKTIILFVLCLITLWFINIYIGFIQ